MPIVNIQKDAKEVIIVTVDHGGHKEGYCFACNARGWVDKYGYPSRVRAHAREKGSRIIHEADCPMNELLNDDGSLKDQG